MTEYNPENIGKSKYSIPTKIKSIAFYSFHADDALSVLRMYGPANAMGIEIIRGVENGDVRFDAVNESDLVIFQRDFCREFDSYVKVISQSHSQNKPVIIDLDDNLFELPRDHPDRLTGYYSDSLLPTLQAVMEADLVTVATNPLREYLLPYNPNIEVIPNYLDDSLWMLSSQPLRVDDDEKIIIGYMGGESHRPDLQMIVPALLQLIEKYPNRISFRFWGIDAPVELAPYSEVYWYPPLFFRYDEFAFAFQSQDADIMIAPLVNNLFNSCKSPIKYFECSAIGVTGVYSDVLPYKGIIENGKDGLLATTPDEWLDALVKLVETPDLRKTLVINAQRNISQNWLLSKNVKKRIKIYEDAITEYHPKGVISIPFYQLEKSLTQQYYEQQQRRDDKVSSLMVQSADKDAVILSLTQQFEDKDANISSIYQQVINKDENIRYLNQQLTDKDVNFISLNKLLEIKDKNIISLNRRLANKIEKIIFLNQQLIDKEDNLLTFNQQLADKDANIVSLKQQLADKDANIVSLKQQLADKDANILSLKQQFVDKDANILSLEQQLADDKKNIFTLNQHLANSDENIQSLKAQKAQLYEDIQTIKTQLAHQDERINELEDEVLSYVLSKSWRLTRPLREFMRIIGRVRNA